ncbi:MAG TPA: cytochrome b562 [Phycisphaerales bacterium]|nr:cytochrome b562 [Phycisphaerales bacterium]
MARSAVRFGVAAVVAGSVLFAAAGMQNGSPRQDGGKPDQKPEQKQEQRQEGQRPGGGRQGGPGMTASVEGGMKGMNRALRTLKGQITDASKREDNLLLINQMQVACVSAKGGKLDEVLKDLKPEEAAAKAKEFRADMISLMRTLLEVEENILNEKFDEAQKALDKAQAARDHGHKEFGVKDD